MLQFYFLSVAANFLAGATLSADWMAASFLPWQASSSRFRRDGPGWSRGSPRCSSGLGNLFVPAALR